MDKKERRRGIEGKGEGKKRKEKEGMSTEKRLYEMLS